MTPRPRLRARRRRPDWRDMLRTRMPPELERRVRREASRPSPEFERMTQCVLSVVRDCLPGDQTRQVSQLGDGARG